MGLLGFDPHLLTETVKNMALPAAKAQAANQTAQARADKKAKEEHDKKVKSSKGGDVEPTNGLTPADLPPLPTEFQPTSNGTDYDGWKLVWQDQFDGHRLDPTKWSVDIDCRHQELQCYTKRNENVYVRDGRLFLHARVHPDGYTPSRTDECTRENDCMATKLYTSGRVKTKSLAKFRYGRIEIRARMPRGQFLWPTLWMLPEDEVHGDWAASGEIDILETTGTDPRTFSSTIHFGGVAPDNKFISSGVQSLVNNDNVPIDLSSRFCLYRLDWTPKYLRTFFEGQKVLDIDLQRKFGAMYKKKGAPFDEDFYLLMNMAVGGEFFGGDDKKLNTTVAKSWERPILEVDYVRVFRMLANDDEDDNESDDSQHSDKTTKESD